MTALRSDVPGSLHCGGGKSRGDGGGLFSGGLMYDSGCRKCFAMMFSRLILGMIKDRWIRFDVLLCSGQTGSTLT